MSPRPWRRMRMLIGWPVGGGIIERVREGGKSVGVGSLGVIFEELV